MAHTAKVGFYFFLWYAFNGELVDQRVKRYRRLFCKLPYVTLLIVEHGGASYNSVGQYCVFWLFCFFMYLFLSYYTVYVLSLFLSCFVVHAELSFQPQVTSCYRL